MRFTVEGADAKSGKEMVITIDADTREQAERIARKRGLLVSDVHTPVTLSESERAEAQVANMLGIGDAPATPPPAKPTMNYGRPLPSTGVPEYTGLLIGKSILIVGAVIYYGVSIAAVLIGFLTYTRRQSDAEGFAALSATAIVAVSAFMGGGLFHALSASCVALRDIARNSFSR